MIPRYKELFDRNYGVFSDDEQERIRKAKILIVGTGGMGGVVAIILARSGIGEFTLVDPQVYEPTNMNRQITCFISTLGQSKVEVTKRYIEDINPEVRVKTYERLSIPQIVDLMKTRDVLVAETDDYPFSLTVANAVREEGKPTVLGFPYGTSGRITVAMPRGSPPEIAFGIPPGLTYEELREALESPSYKCAQRYYVTEGNWKVEWYKKYIEEGAPFTQICPNVWLCASLVALEVLKLVTKRWRPVVTPHRWHIMSDKGRIKVDRFSRFWCLWYRLIWYFLHTRIGPKLHDIILERWFKWWLSRHEKIEKKRRHYYHYR